MAVLKAMTKQFVTKLQNSIAPNLDRYQQSTPWAAAFAGNDPWEMPTPCEVCAPLSMMSPEFGNHHDLENAIRLHKALPGLTPLQAQDPRLWTRLTHVELWKYMRERWPIEKHMENRDMAIGRVRERYFVAQRQSRALVRNGAARLWWAAKLTFDPDRDNPYELTHVLLSSLDIAKNVLERNFGRAPNVTLTFLEYLLRNKDECLYNGNHSRLLVRHLTKALNLHGGICLLDCMTRKEITAFLAQEQAKILVNGEAETDDQDSDE